MASTDVAAARVPDRAATVVTMVEATQVIVVVAALGTAEPAMLRKMSVATASNVGTGLESAGRRKGMRRLKPHR
jgi:hypothetical protein